MTSDELLIDELRAQRDALLRHFEGLDAKAGIVMGFAGLIATLAPTAGALAIAGRSLAILAALFALVSFAPRRFPALNPKLLPVGPNVEPMKVTAVRIRALLARGMSAADAVLRSKERTLAVGVVLVVAATVVLGSAIIVEGVAQ